MIGRHSGAVAAGIVHSCWRGYAYMSGWLQIMDFMLRVKARELCC